MNVNYDDYFSIVDIEDIIRVFNITQYVIKDVLVDLFDLTPEDLEDYDLAYNSDHYINSLHDIIIDFDLSLSDIIYYFTRKDRDNMYSIWDHSDHDDPVYEIGVVSLNGLYNQILANLDKNDIDIQLQLLLRGSDDKVPR